MRKAVVFYWIGFAIAAAAFLFLLSSRVDDTLLMLGAAMCLAYAFAGMPYLLLESEGGPQTGMILTNFFAFIVALLLVAQVLWNIEKTGSARTYVSMIGAAIGGVYIVVAIVILIIGIIQKKAESLA